MLGGAVFHMRSISAGVGAADLVDEVAEGALQLEGFGGTGAGGMDRAGVFVPQCVDSGGGYWSCLAVAP